MPEKSSDKGPVGIPSSVDSNIYTTTHHPSIVLYTQGRLGWYPGSPGKFNTTSDQRKGLSFLFLLPIMTPINTKTAWHAWYDKYINPIIFLSHIYQLYSLLPSHSILSSILMWVMSTLQHGLTYSPIIKLMKIYPTSLYATKCPAPVSLSLLLTVDGEECGAHS